jgi:hypothetical protein
MAIPSGSGTEVLKFTNMRALSNTWSTIFTGVANHIYTIISIVCANTTSVAESLNMGFADDGSNTNLNYLFLSQDLPGYGTFVWSDRVVFSGTKYLRAAADSSADIDVWVSYIDQDWT